jgi:tetratricopeptide (TPR) repeat protein
VEMQPRVVFRAVLTLWVLTCTLLFIVHYTVRDSLPQPLLDHVRAQADAELSGPEKAIGLAWVLVLGVALVGLYAFWGPARVLWLIALVLVGPLTGRSPTVAPGPSSALEAYAFALGGAVLAMSYCRPFSGLFASGGPYGRGVELVQKGHFEQAIASFTEAIRLDPRLTDAYAGRAAAHCALGAYERCIADCNEAIRLGPQETSFYSVRGVAHEHQGKLEEAFRDYNEALRLDPANVSAYYNRAHATFMKADYARAAEDFSEAIRLNPADKVLAAKAFDFRAKAYRALGDETKAACDERKARDLRGE